MPTSELVKFIDQIRDRFPRLPDSVMGERAGLSKNAVHRIRGGTVPRPSTLKALADTWGRTPDERATDYRELMTRAGYDMPEADAQATPAEAAWLKILGELTPEQRQRVQAFFLSLDATDEFTAGAEELQAASLERLLAVVMRMSEEERRRWVYDNLQQLQS